MGLDMYLSAIVYLSKYNKDEQVIKQRNEIYKLFPEIKSTENLDAIEVKFEAGYWRKANQIHKWFVDNAQDGVDNCGYYYVAVEQLTELKKLCQEVLADHSKAKELLPVERGFFFGSETYDEYYFDDLEDTIKIIDYCLSLPTKFGFEYHSSW